MNYAHLFESGCVHWMRLSVLHLFWNQLWLCTVMNLLITLLLIFTKQTVECNVNWRQPEATTTQKPEENGFPCDTFICLLDHFELLNTAKGGYLLKEKQASEKKTCSTFRCWIQQYNVQRKSYGYELIKSTVSTIKNTETTTSHLNIFQMYKEPALDQNWQSQNGQNWEDRPIQEDQNWEDQDFYDLFY